ncbi:hypothetical protein ACSX1A_06065 [Pontibacter sp. MBLB2868]|uniref:hypothetical protein n=1 Tax=Pontibacter sp. MBLB2868 TaxID=3451555 RepID=UPI003F755E82
MLYYKSDYLEIYYSQGGLVETRWLKFASSEEYRAGLAMYSDVVRQKEVKLWLGDYRLAKVVRLHDQGWAAREWFPQFIALATDIKRMARVQSMDIFNETSSENIKRKINIEGLPFEFTEFKDYDEGRAWVLEK